MTTKITFERDTKEVPCDCQQGHCGWKHYAYDGPARFYINSRPVSEEAAKHAYYMSRDGDV